MQPGLLGAISPEEQRGLLEPYEQRLRLADVQRAPGAVADAFGQAGRAGLEGYATALSGVDADGRTVGGILPMAMDERTGERSLAAPRILDLWNTVGGVVPGGGAVLGAGPVVRRGGQALDMSQEARMARAAEQGYGPALYHGTAADIPAFDRAKFGSATGAKSAKMGTWVVDSPSTAKGYATYAGQQAPVRRLMKMAEQAEKRGNWDEYDRLLAQAETLEQSMPMEAGQVVMPLRVKGNMFEFDARGAEYTDIEKEIYKNIQRAKLRGYDGVRIENLADDVGFNGRPATHTLVFDPKNIRSTQAAFDPARADSADLLASRAAPGGLLAAPERERLTYRDIEGLL